MMANMTTNQSTSASAPGRHYLHNLFDNARWQEVELRAGDIVVCTSYKSGTTWTQMVCALLVHQSPQLPRSLAELSPWVDARFSSIDNIAAALKAQSHTRIIKTHTPLDGLPRQAGVRYLFCGREPRDVFMSLQNHLANANRERIVELLADQGITYRGGELPESLDDRFALWITRGTFPWENDGAPFWSHLAHAQSFWDCRDDAALHFLHYADLKHDLEGEMRRLAELLDVSVDEALWPALVKAATFEDMKKMRI